MPEQVRVTQCGAELLLQPTATLSVSQLGAEIALEPTPTLTITQLGAEFLVTVLIYPPIGDSRRTLLGVGA